MLVLSRKERQSIFITLEDGRVITVAVVGINPSHKAVKIGIDAPKSIQIVREELKERDERNDNKI